MAEREKENESKSGMPIDGAQEKKNKMKSGGRKRERKRNKHMQKI